MLVNYSIHARKLFNRMGRKERAKLFYIAGFSSLSVSWGKKWDDYHLLPIGGAIRVT